MRFLTSRWAELQVFNSWVEGNGEAAVCAFGAGSNIMAANSDLGMPRHAHPFLRIPCPEFLLAVPVCVQVELRVLRPAAPCKGQRNVFFTLLLCAKVRASTAGRLRRVGGAPSFDAASWATWRLVSSVSTRGASSTLRHARLRTTVSKSRIILLHTWRASSQVRKQAQYA